MAYDEKDTIVAIATAPGDGAIGIIRLSGSRAAVIAGKMFRCRKGTSFDQMIPYRLTLGLLIDPLDNEPIDEALAVFMPGPRSYTGENTVEFQAHGGQVLLERGYRAALEAGARPAEPGEFTRRAFLNGRLDLTQAESVIDLIRSRSAASGRMALRHLGGEFSRRVGSIRETLCDLAAAIEGDLDFGEEDGAGEGFDGESLQRLADTIRDLLTDARESPAATAEARVVLCGRTNVGKSSLLNQLLGKERAIVAPSPGTTRDTLEAALYAGGVTSLLIDTAGLGRLVDQVDPVEKEGMRRSREILQEADLALVVLDASQPLDDTDRELLEGALKGNSIVVLNKCDLPPLTGAGGVSGLAPGRKVVATSALTGEGVATLRQAVIEAARLLAAEAGEHSPLVSNARHGRALRESLAAIERAVGNLRDGNPVEVVAVDVRNALRALGEITGETATEEILDRIFSRFCIGK